MNTPKHSVLAIGINLPDNEKITIQKNLKLDDITLDTASIKDIIIKIIDGNIKVSIKNKDITRYNYIWIQSGWTTTHMAYILDLYLISQNIPHNTTNIYFTKLSDMYILASKGISVPNTFFHNGQKINEKNLEDIETICKLPCIYKTSLGSLGSNVFLIDQKCKIEETIHDKKKYNKYMFQEYIPNDFDYRIVIANGKPSSACIRTRVNDKYRNNVALGAKEDFIDLKNIPQQVLDIAVESAKALNLDWAGVDVVTDKKTGINYVLEVNRRPGLTENSSEIAAFYKHIKELVN
jgi:D-alanine-D-alanine ligase-like ATP-grasp enzyme